MRDVLQNFIIIITQVLLLNLLCTSTVQVQRETLKVRIHATGDTIVLTFMRPHMDMKLEGYILGYGSSMFSKQYIQLPENGEPYETELEAEPKYLIAVKSVKANKVKKPCPEKVTLEKPLHLVIGSVTPTSVLLSWGTLLKTPYTDTDLDDCLEESHFTVRYREEEPNKHWNYQTCPGTSTVIDNLKPDTHYEFAVREDNNRRDWTPTVIHNTADVGIHELLQPKNLLKTPEPIVKALTTIPPTVPVLHNITQSSSTPLSKFTEPPPASSTTLGTGSDDITSSPSEDPLFLTQTASFIHTPTSQSPSTTDTFQPQQSTISPPSTTTQQQQRTTQYTTSTTETQPSSTITQVTTTEPLSSTTERQPSTTETTGQLQFTTDHPQTNTTQPQPSTTQQKLKKVQSQPIITKPKTGTKPTLTQPNPKTTQSQSSPTQLKTTQHSPRKPKATQPLPRQPKTTQHPPRKPKTTQPSPRQPKTTQPSPRQSKTTKPSPTQPTTQLSPTQPTTTQPSPTQPTTTQPSPTQPTTTQPSPRQPKTTQPSPTQPTTTQPSPTQPTTQPLPTQPTTQPSPTQPTTTQTSPAQQTTTQPSPTQPTTQPLPTQPTTQPSPTQPTTTQPSPTQPTTTQTITTQSQSSTTHQKLRTQHKAITKPRTTQNKAITNARTTQTPSTSQTRKPQQKPNESQTPTSTTQQQITPHPNLIKEKTISVLPGLLIKNQPTKIQHPTTSQEIPFITKKTQSKLIHQESLVSQYSLYDISSTLSPIQNSDHYMPGTTEIVEEPGKQPQTSTKPQYQTKPAPSHQPTSSTIYYYGITQHQYNYTTITTLKSKLQVSSNGPNPTDNYVHAFNSIKTLTPTAKSNVDENSPWAETQADTVNKKVPGSQAGQSIFRNSTTPPPVIRPSAHKVKPNGTPRRRVPSGSPPKVVRVNPLFKNMSLDRVNGHSGEKHKGMQRNKPTKEPRRNNGAPANQPRRHPNKKRPNQVEKQIDKGKDKTVPDLKLVESLPILKPQPVPTTEKTVYLKPTPTPCFAFNGSCFGSDDNSSIFSSVPVSDVDATGKKRFVAPHVLYKTDKPPEQPCSVTDSLSYFPDEEAMNINVTGPPKFAPSNLTVVTVEGCPSFVILDWEKTDNETTEYEVTSSTKGPKGKEVSLLTTNQTHTAVENLKPESSYEFTVTPKNEMGSGPSSEPVKFSTESVDPRVSDIPTGKNAIWSSFPFKAADSYSECNGRMFVKRTWYRKYVGIQLCNSLRYKIYLSDTLKGKFYNIGDQTGNGEDHCQFVDSFLDGRTGGPLPSNRLPPKDGYFRAVRQEPVQFGKIGGSTHINYVAWYECGVPIPGSW